MTCARPGGHRAVKMRPHDGGTAKPQYNEIVKRSTLLRSIYILLHQNSAPGIQEYHQCTSVVRTCSKDPCIGTLETFAALLSRWETAAKRAFLVQSNPTEMYLKRCHVNKIHCK